jgi:TonB family protein
MSLEPASQRAIPRRPLFVPLDVIVLRSGIPENLPGRCTDLSEGGVGAIVAGDLIPGQQVAVELRLPNVGVPMRARALVRYQQRLRCGLQFVGLTPEQREMIRYWASRIPAKPAPQVKKEEPASLPAAPAKTKVRKIRMQLELVYALLACVVVVVGMGWWQWERSWKDLEDKVARTPAAGETLRVSPEEMARRITFKTDPVYPEAARQAGTQGVVVLDAVINPDGSVKQLRAASGDDVLVESATAAVKAWTFAPYLVDGKPHQVATTITVEFSLR